jgi:hypothetical protein
LLLMNTAPVLVTPIPIVATLLTGLLIAFAVQLLLTSFGAAAGITALGFLTGDRSNSPQDSPEPKASEEAKGGTGVIGVAVGLGTLTTVNTVLFVAAFLSVKLSLVSSAILGAILGVVIWAATSWWWRGLAPVRWVAAGIDRQHRDGWSSGIDLQPFNCVWAQGLNSIAP